MLLNGRKTLCRESRNALPICRNKVAGEQGDDAAGFFIVSSPLTIDPSKVDTRGSARCGQRLITLPPIRPAQMPGTADHRNEDPGVAGVR